MNQPFKIDFGYYSWDVKSKT